jgi:hypothetical protein
MPGGEVGEPLGGKVVRMRRMAIVLALALVPIMGPAVLSPAEAGTAAVAAGSLQADFNNDGFIDAAVGVPLEDIGGTLDAGAVNVLYGSASGLTGAGSQQFWQGAGGVPGPAEAGDLFGFSLATGDFNNDGFADLAVGAPFEDVGSIVDAGLVNVLYGSAAGLTGAGSQQFWQGAGGGGVSGTTEAGDSFGFWLASGDFNANSFDDLAVGVVGEDIGSIVDAGSVNVLSGSAAGLTGAGSQQFWQGAGLPGSAEAGDGLGFALVAGDFNNDTFVDLAAGAPFEAIGSAVEAGSVNVLPGSAAGLTSAGSQQFWQGAAGVAGTAEAGDFFGSALAAGDFNNDGFAELAIGAPVESIGSIAGAGAVNVLRGTAAGLTGAGSQQFWQGSGGITGTTEVGDNLGSSLAGGDFNNDGFADLSVGVVGEDIGSVPDAGAVNVLHGTAGGLTGVGSQGFWQGSGGITGTSEAGDGVGFAVAAGDFNNDSFVDLVAGVPFESIGAVAGAGAVNVLHGTAGGLTGTGSQGFWQGTGVPGTAEEGDLFGFALVGGDLSSASAASTASASAASAGSASSAAGSSAALSRFLPKPKTTATQGAQQAQVTGL